MWKQSENVMASIETAEMIIFNNSGNACNKCLCLHWKKVESVFVKPITSQQNLDSSKLKEFADNNFKFDENGRKLSKQVENTVGKGEIARYEQFLLFPQCF